MNKKRMYSLIDPQGNVVYVRIMTEIEALQAWGCMIDDGYRFDYMDIDEED